jgi:predicted permease
MPQLPIIIPIIVIGILIGRLQKSKTPKVSWRRLALWALVAGALNAANAYVVYILTPQPTFRGAATGTFVRTATTSEIGFTTASFLAGFLIVAAVFAIAAAYGRVRKGDSELEEEPEPEADTEDLSKLKAN